MKAFLKRNAVILIAFSLPVILIVGVVLSTYIPSLFLSTNYDFVYTTCTDNGGYYSYNCREYLQQRYTVLNNKLIMKPELQYQDSDKDGVMDINEYTPRIFLHDTQKNQSKEITFEEAQQLSLNGLLSSPDGVTISDSYDRGAEFLFFYGGGSSYGHYLTKGKSRIKLNLINSTDTYYYENSFQFIGWVLPGRN